MIYFVDYTRAVEGPARSSSCSQSGSDLVDLLRRLRDLLRSAKKRVLPQIVQEIYTFCYELIRNLISICTVCRCGYTLLHFLHIILKCFIFDVAVVTPCYYYSSTR